MNAMKIIVRLEAEQRIAELELLASHGETMGVDTASALERLGFAILQNSDYTTPRHRITRIVFQERNHQRLEHARIAEALSELRRSPSNLRPCAVELAA